MNKSQIARDFYRRLFDDQSIDLRDSDARNKAVNAFFDLPENKKNWNKTKDRRFFRLGFDKVCKERNFNPYSVGIKPIAQTSQKTQGGFKMNVKTDEKKGIPYQKITDPKIPNSKELQQGGQEAQQKAQEFEIAQASFYSAESVGLIFDTMFNLLHARFNECEKLSNEERQALGDSWRPIFDKYLGDKGGIWVMPILISAPIVLTRVAQYNTALKTAELQADLFPPDEPEEKNDKNNKWRDLGKP